MSLFLLPIAHWKEDPLISSSRIKPPWNQFYWQNEGIIKKDLERVNAPKEEE